MTDKGAIGKQLDGHTRRNEALRERLRANGVPLSEERPIDVHFWASTRRDAAVLARELFKIGFLITLLAPSSAPDGDGTEEERWVVEAGATVAPERALGERFTERMVRLAAAQGAIYDGWGTSMQWNSSCDCFTTQLRTSNSQAAQRRGITLLLGFGSLGFDRQPACARAANLEHLPGLTCSGQLSEYPVQLPAANIVDPQLWNRYAYARNNPLRYTDPDGRCIWDWCVAEIAAVAGVSGATVAAAEAATAATLFVWHNRGRITESVIEAQQALRSGIQWARNEISNVPDRTAQDPLRRDENGKAIPDPEAAGRDHS